MPSHSKKQHDFMEAIAHSKAFADKVHIPQKVGRDFVEADKGKHFKKGGINMATMKKRSVNPAMAMMAARAMRTPPMDTSMAPPPAMPMGGAPGMKHGGLSKAHHKHLAHHHLAMAEHHMAQHEGHGMKHGGKVHKMAHGGMAHHEKEKMHEMKQAKQLRHLASEEEHEAKMMRHGGKAHMKKMAMGGHAESMGPRGMNEDVEKGSNKHGRYGESKVQKTGHTRGKNLGDAGKEIGIEGGMKRGGHIKKMAHGGSTSHRADGIAKRGHTKTKYC